MKTGILIIAAAALATSTVQAETKAENHRGENIGIGGGGVVGAILGGPVGFIIGSATGAWVGNKFDREKTRRDRLEDQVADAESRYQHADELAQSLQTLVTSNETEIESMRLVMRSQEGRYRDALSEAFDIEVYFRTGEAALAEQVAERVERLGSILAGFEDISIFVEGHADPRGEETYNEQLSAERAQAVREALLRAGLPEERITTRSLGEQNSMAVDGDLDAMALERRVDVSIVYPLPRENRVARQ